MTIKIISDQILSHLHTFVHHLENFTLLKIQSFLDPNGNITINVTLYEV